MYRSIILFVLLFIEKKNKYRERGIEKKSQGPTQDTTQ
jgi:hypothetical protein